MSAVVETDGLTKRYGELTVVDRVALSVPEGSLFGFLGPNGSGKTTTIRMMLGLVFASAGSVTMLGRPMPDCAGEVLPHVGALVEGPGFYPYLSGRRNLDLLDSSGARAAGGRRGRRRRIDDVLEQVGLAHVGPRPVKAYSLGMRQRLGLAAALLRTPRLLVLDEPTNGLDPNGIHELRQLFVDLTHRGTTVFLSSHQLNEVELICSHVAMMSSGRVVAQGRLDHLLAPTGVIDITTPDVAAACTVLSGLRGPRVLDVGEHRVRIGIDGITSESVVDALVQGGVRLRAFAPEQRTLEDVFLELTEADALR